MTVAIQEIAKRSDIKFGTSGLRGLVENLTDEVCFAYTKAFLLSQEGAFKKVAIGHDLRPSSLQITQACISAIESEGIEAIYIGALPTPAVAYFCLEKKMPGIMVTGSHIPFDRNGIKFFRADGEISKAVEESIMGSHVEIEGHNVTTDLPEMNNDAIELYRQRYINFFGSNFLAGKTVAIYQHSSVARDFLGDLFQAMGAKTLLLGRSNEFVPIDTEAVRDEDIKQAKSWATQYDFDMLVSTDGDADRPLIADEHGDFIRGDILGILTAQYLQADHVATPVSSNTAVELSNSFSSVIRTKIGSPFVIEAMDDIAAVDSTKLIVGYEANGGFLQGSALNIGGMILNSLPTRDAILPMLSLMGLSIDRENPVSKLNERLPARFTHSDRIQNYPLEKSSALLKSLTHKPESLSHYLDTNPGEVIATDFTDGLRVTFKIGDIVHLRPSGNAPELRCYAESDTGKNARNIVDGILKGIASRQA